MVIKFLWTLGFLLLLAGCGAQTPTATVIPTPAPPTFELTVTSADNSINFTAASFTAQRDAENDVVSITFSAADGQTMQVFFEPEAQPGSSTLIASTDAMNPQRTPLNGIWLLAQTSPAGAEPVYFSKDAAGTATLTTRSRVLSGTIDATLANADALTITIRGSFNNIPV